MRKKELDILFEPLKMKNLTLKNRFFMAPMGTTFDLGQLKDYFVARAKGGVGLITTGLASVHPSGRAGESLGIRLEADSDIEICRPIVKAVKEAGARFIVQLSHAGRYAFSATLGQPSVAPSAIRSRYTGETPRALSTQEADDLVVCFADAAFRAREAGFDGVEICANSGYLISQFLSPVTNKREDKYGGDALQRAAFLFSVLHEIRKRVGEEYNICVKFDAQDGVQGGRTLEESLVLAPKIVEAGADRLHIWAGWHESTRPMLPMFVPRGAFSHLSAAIKKVVNVPVSTVGRINDPDVAAGILHRKEADLIGLGRQLLCDPEFVRKTEEGQTDEIRRCIACVSCLDDLMSNIRSFERNELRCTLNPELGHEGEALLKKSPTAKKVTVVGGGPAGMEAARAAAVRGHDVTLYESERLGGLIHLAVIPPFKEELRNILDYYPKQLSLLNVKIMQETFTPDMVDKSRPDVIILATGAKEMLPNIKGVEQEHVVSALDVLRGHVKTGGNVFVVGGGLIGLETGEVLSDQGFQVTVCEMLKSVAADVGASSRWGMVARIGKKIKIMTSTKVVEIKKDRVVVESEKNGLQEIPADSVVIATGLRSENSLAKLLKDRNVEYYEVGSCRNPGKIGSAIREAFYAACRI